MKERYPLVSGALPVPITKSYTYGDTYISVSSLNYLPVAPNIVTLTDDKGYFLTVQYNEITGNSLTGLHYLEGDIDHTFIANVACATRAITNYDFEAMNEVIDSKVDKVDGKSLTAEEYTLAEKLKLAGIEDGAQVNTLESISINGVSFPIVNKNVNLTIASDTSLGVIKVGNGLTVATDGTLSTSPLAGTGISVIEIDGVAVPCMNNIASFPLATVFKDGAMSKGDKLKLNTIENDAEKNKIDSIRVNTTDIPISTDKVAEIKLKTVGGCSIVGEGNIPVCGGEIPYIIGNSLVFENEEDPVIVENTLVFKGGGC